MKNKNTQFYVDNKEMYEEIILCQKNGMKISNKLGKMFMLIAKKFATMPNFSGYSYIEDMISSGILACVVAFPKFDVNKSNQPFSYFTQVIYHSFLQSLSKEQRVQDTKDLILLDNNMTPSFGFGENDED